MSLEEIRENIKTLAIKEALESGKEKLIDEYKSLWISFLNLEEDCFEMVFEEEIFLTDLIRMKELSNGLYVIRIDPFDSEKLVINFQPDSEKIERLKSLILF